MKISTPQIAAVIGVLTASAYVLYKLATWEKTNPFPTTWWEWAILASGVIGHAYIKSTGDTPTSQPICQRAS